MKVPHPIPYQGSKRNLAAQITRYLPTNTKCLIEPFAGSAAISLAAAVQECASDFHLNDLNTPLIRLWAEIIDRPEQIATQYVALWEAQHEGSREHYDAIREEFNQTGRPDQFLYLLARCVKAAVRYNANGQFNQSPDNRRLGALPETMRRHIFGASYLLKNKTVCSAADYKTIALQAGADDVVYLDPPYQGVCNKRDPRYLQSVPYDEFVQVLETLNARDISYLVSYDGRTGDKQHGKLLPPHLRLHHVELEAGRSSQATLLGREDVTFESLYISPALALRIELSPALPQMQDNRINSLLEIAP